MLMMPAFQPVSEIFATRGTADAHDACLEPRELRFFVAGSAADARVVGFKAAECQPRELRLMLLMPVCTPVSDIHSPQLRLVASFSHGNCG